MNFLQIVLPDVAEVDQEICCLKVIFYIFR